MNIRIILVVIMLAILGLPLGTSATALSPAQLSQLPQWPVTIIPYGGTLLLSDSPEMPDTDGILYRDQVVGQARLFLYHVNGAASTKKILATLHNSGQQVAEVTVYRSALAGPSANYLQVGKSAQQAYFAPDAELYTIAVPRGATVLLDPRLDRLMVSPQMLVNGIYDFVTTQPLTVTTLIVSANRPSLAATAKLPVLPTDRDRLRGTFSQMDRLVLPLALPSAPLNTPVAVDLADNQHDQYARGIDATTGLPALNYGNYGIVYQLFMPHTGSGSVHYALNPQGGVYAGAVGIKLNQQLLAPISTPADKLHFGEQTVTAVATLGKYSANDSLWLQFSPPGASNLPIRLIYY